MTTTQAERPDLAEPPAPPETPYVVVPERVWLNQKPAASLEPMDGEFPAPGEDAPTEDDYYHRHLERPPMSHARVSTLGGLCTSVVSGALPGILIGVPGGIVAGVAAGLFGGLIGRELTGEFLDRRHDG